MTSLPKVDTYPLARGVIDSVRLNLCHFIWKKSFPWVVHPSVSLEGRSNLRIADVGCGTGSVQSSLHSTPLRQAALRTIPADTSSTESGCWRPPKTIPKPRVSKVLTSHYIKLPRSICFRTMSTSNTSTCKKTSPPSS
jgi:hypothetical protein